MVTSIRCHQCGVIAVTGNRFCMKCGAQVGCVECGHLNPPDAQFCGNCGQSFASAAPAPDADGSQGSSVGEGSHQILGFNLQELRTEAQIEDECDHTPAAGNPIHMSQDELDNLFDLDNQ